MSHTYHHATLEFVTPGAPTRRELRSAEQVWRAGRPADDACAALIAARAAQARRRRLSIFARLQALLR